MSESFNHKKIYIAGHRGMVGSAIVRHLQMAGVKNIVCRTHDELDLTNQQAVINFFREEKPDYVVLAAAKVGGIFANNEYPADFIYQNLMMECNVIHEAYAHGVKELLFLGSSCVYPKHAAQPMTEAALLTGALEPTNEPYAIAKIAGIKLCESYNRQFGTDYRSIMPTNLYGPGDNYHGQNSHVIPALIKKIHEAKISGAPTVDVWGTGEVRREFLHVNDLADAAFFIMNLPKADYDKNAQPMLSHINVGTGKDITIDELAKLICEVVGFTGDLVYDSSKPNGAPQKLMDVSRLKKLGWQAGIPLKEGLTNAYQWFLRNL